MSDPIVITRELVKRGWSDFEPKLITGLLTGSVAAFIVSMAPQFGIHLSTLQENFVAVACFFLGGYLTPSTGTAVTKRIDAGLREVEQHTGSTVTTVTNSTPVQAPARSTPAFSQVVNDVSVAPSSTPSTPTIALPSPDATPTEVAPQYSRGQNILDAIRDRANGADQ